MCDYVQAGYNNKYPIKISTWTFNNPAPSWLSDISRVNYLDQDGRIFITTKQYSSDSFSIIAADSVSNLIVVKNNNIVCFGDNKLFQLSPKQLELLYKKVN